MIFRNFFSKLLVSRGDKVQGSFQTYRQLLDSGRLRDRFCYGIADSKKGFHIVNPIKDPGALFCGGMGSGKSEAMKFTVGTHMAANSDHTLYLLVDMEKGMNEYASLFKYENVITALNDPAKIVPVIDMVYDEYLARKDLFTQEGIKVNNILSYEEMAKNPDFIEKMKKRGIDTPKKLSRIVICCEEFHAIPNSKQVQFSFRYDTPGTIANKLRLLLRAGRSYGIVLLAASQRATSGDFPTELKPGISEIMAFKTANPMDMAALNLPHGDKIRETGRCANKDGFIQFPYFPRKGDFERLLDAYHKPFNASLIAHSLDDFKTALSGEGNDGMVDVKPLKELLINASSFSITAIAIRILKEFDYKILPIENEAMAVDIVAEKDGQKVAIMTISEKMTKDKRVDAFVEGANLLNCDRAIILGFESIPMRTSTGTIAINGEEGIIVDSEDLLRIAEVMDNKEALKEAGQFDRLYSKLALADQPTEELQAQEDLMESFNELINNSQKKNRKVIVKTGGDGKKLDLKKELKRI